jgi:acyl-coenzyme A thioesterase PaaI-like protein
VGSAASQFFINAKEQEVRGIEISANHLRSIHEGVVTGAIYTQRKNASSVEIKITDEEGNLISFAS